MAASLTLFLLQVKIILSNFFKSCAELDVVTWWITFGKPNHACGFLLSELSCGELPVLILGHWQPRHLSQRKGHGIEGFRWVCVGEWEVVHCFSV